MFIRTSTCTHIFIYLYINNFILKKLLCIYLYIVIDNNIYNIYYYTLNNY